MIGKKLWMSLGVIAVVIGVGFFVYSVINNSPEMKLAKALDRLLEAEKIQIETEQKGTLDFEISPEELGLAYDEEVYLDIFQDLLQNFEATSSTIYDKEEKVLEVDGSFGISGDVQGENITLHFPISVYLDEKENEWAVDLDPYVQFVPELIDVLAYNVVPNVPEIEQELALIVDGDLSDWISKEAGAIINPILEGSMKEKKYTFDNKLPASLFEMTEFESESWEYVEQFFVDKMLDYYKEHAEEGFITEEDGWIYLDLDQLLFYESLIYALEEVEADENAKEALEKYDVNVKDAIEVFDEVIDEYKDTETSAKLGFFIEKGILKQMTAEVTSSFEEDGATISSTSTSTSTFKYNEDVEYRFYGKDRDIITDDDIEQMMYDIEMDFESAIAQLQQDYYEEELSEEDLALLAAIEAQEVSHEDFGFTEVEMYFWVLDLELAGLVEPGTSDLYLE